MNEEIIDLDLVKDAWLVYSRLYVMEEQDVNVAMMKHVIERLSPLYMCNRPPGAAGAVLYASGKIVYGHVTSPVGATCKDIGCEIVDGHCTRTVHAERRALLLAAQYGIATAGSKLFSILKPCYECTKELIVAGVKEVYYAGAAYDEDRTRHILELAQVTCTHLDVGLDYGIMRSE